MNHFLHEIHLISYIIRRYCSKKHSEIEISVRERKGDRKRPLIRHQKPKSCDLKWTISYLSIKALVCQWVSEAVSVFVCSLTPTKRRIRMSWNFEGCFPLGCRRFRLKNIRIRRTVSRKKNRACPVRPLWSPFPSCIILLILPMYTTIL